MRTIDGDKIFSVILSHSGAENAISARDICRELGWPEHRERTVRRIISDESCLWTVDRHSPALVCGLNGGRGDATGYFVAVSYEEAEKYDNWLDGLKRTATRKHFNFREACSRMGIRFQERKEDNAERPTLNAQRSSQNGDASGTHALHRARSL